MRKTSIIILNYNTYELIKLCIESIRYYTRSGSYEIIVIDNGSKDESVAWLRQQSDIRTIFNNTNVGFPAGCNQGIKVATGTEILLLNSDTIVTVHWLEQLCTALYSNAKIGAVSCISNYCSNGQQIAVKYKSIQDMQSFAREYNHINPSKWKSKATLVGFCFLFKREVYEQIGLLDEMFSPGNYEDDDYSLRILQAGYDLLLCTDTFIHHFGSGSFTKSKTEDERQKKIEEYNTLLESNSRLFFQKWKVPKDYKSMTKDELMPYLQRRDAGNKAMIIPVNFANFESTVRKIYIDQEKHVGVTLGPGSYLVNGSLEYGSKDCHVLIGRYCSLGHRLTFEVGLNHDYHQVTTYPFEDLMSKDNNKLNHSDSANHNQIIIGNDVWIGCDVTIMGGVRIGNGAVIGAGTVIANDIPSYAVVVGNPGKVIKYRFDNETISKLQQIKWWNWPGNRIEKNLKLMKSTDKFIEKYYKKLEAIHTEVSDNLFGLRQDGWKIIGFAGDFQAEYPLWENVIHQYLNSFTAEDKVIFILEISSTLDTSRELQKITEALQQAGELAPAIMTHIYEEEIIPNDVISGLHYFITNREDITSRCIDYAINYGVNIICGFDDWTKKVKK